jgi:pyridoxamine 5'-phosphate oxidase
LTDLFLAQRLPDELPGNPMHWAAAWLDEATSQQVQRNPNSMTLVTVGAEGWPSARVVLCKDFVPDPGYLVFYTNYRSRKVLELRANPRVAVTFHWDALGRQVRIEGIAMLSPAAESDAYFASRHWGSQLGAWGSDQSAPLASRDALFAQLRERAAELELNVSDDLQSLQDADRPAIPRPDHWGGVRVWANRVELWIEGKDRIHDRACWQRSLDGKDEHEFTAGPWQGTRLQP